jgi:hypothetical protein
MVWPLCVQCNVGVGSKPEKLAMSTCFPLCPLKPDIAQRSRHVRFAPEAVMEAYSITSVAKPKTAAGISMPTIFAVFKFTTNSNLLD